MKYHISSNNAFTFVEMLIAITIVGVGIPLIFSIIFSIVREQTKVKNTLEVKKQADAILTRISNTVRNDAVAIYSDQTLAIEECANDQETYGPQADGNNFFLKTSKGGWLQFTINLSKQLELKSASGSSQITSSNVAIQNFEISCERQTVSRPSLISINFDAVYSATTIPGDQITQRAEEKVSLSYKSKIKLRNLESSQINQ